MNPNTATTRRTFLGVAAASVLLAACGGDNETSSSTSSDTAAETGASNESTSAQGIRLVTAADGAAIAADPPEDLVILDVRTPEEFAEGHIDGATMIDFYSDDFADQIADLDPAVPYLLYCRSGNRSGQTTTLMADLGFGDVADIDGGILAWDQAGQSTVTG